MKSLGVGIVIAIFCGVALAEHSAYRQQGERMRVVTGKCDCFCRAELSYGYEKPIATLDLCAEDWERPRPYREWKNWNAKDSVHGCKDFSWEFAVEPSTKDCTSVEGRPCGKGFYLYHNGDGRGANSHQSSGKLSECKYIVQ
ncbi:MAG: hypothetical protein HY537_16160 [Deltaproteobacteria bacterium]|nr:hypothetical protein [Deltaproteobacteria bacterium]